MVLPPHFPIQSTSAIASYSFTDLAEGTGTVVYYGTAEEDNSGITYALSGSTRYAVPRFTTEAVASGGAAVKEIDLDFDVTFNTPRVVNGELYVSIPVTSLCNITDNTNIYVIAVVSKESGGSTTLSTMTSKTFASGVSGANRRFRIVMKDSVTNINFKRGDILRFNVQIWAHLPPASGTCSVTLNHDPLQLEAEVDDIGTDLTLRVPFKINL